MTINPNLTVEQHEQFGSKVFDINLKAEAIQIENDAYLSAWDIEQEDLGTVTVLVQTALGEYQYSLETSTPDAAE